MEQYDNKLIPHSLEFEDEIETNLENGTLETIHETERSLQVDSIISQLNEVRNSILGINRLIPDILYDIFALAVHTSPYPEMTALDISHVCRRWRESALGWPILWTFMNLGRSPSYVNLLMERSQSAPLVVVWWTDEGEVPSESYFISHADSILSRLYSLTIRTLYSHFNQFLHAIQKSELPALQLRDLDIRLFDDRDVGAVPTLSTHLLYNSCLQDVKLVEFDLPWYGLLHNNLTDFTFRNSTNPPTLSQLLTFLSNCPTLRTLELEFRDENGFCIRAAFAMTTSTSPPTTDKLALNLTRLKLGARGSSSYDFVQQFSKSIRISGALSQFELLCDPASSTDSSSTESGSRVDHWPVPQGAFSHFSHYQYLNIYFKESEGSLRICGHTSASDHDFESYNPPCPIHIDHESSWPLDYSPVILELVYAMHQIGHLALISGAWLVFTSWPGLDIRRAFPQLDTLELIEFGPDGVDSLRESLQIQKLILKSCVVSAEVLLEAVSRIGIRVLELIQPCIINENENVDIEDVDINSTLCDIGVDVVWK